MKNEQKGTTLLLLQYELFVLCIKIIQMYIYIKKYIILSHHLTPNSHYTDVKTYVRVLFQ